LPKLDVIENALDFLDSAGRNLLDFEASASPRDVKYALLHLAAGIALLLKQRLAKDHWALVFDDLNKASKVLYDSGDFTSPGLEQCLERVRSVCGVEISSVDKNSLMSLRKLRNKIEHFRFEVSREEGLSIAVKVWPFAFDFVQDQLAQDFNDNQNQQWESVRTKMLGIEEFVRQRHDETAPLVKAKESEGFTIVDCPLCLETALYLEIEERGCLFCRYVAELDEVFDAWMTTFYGSDWTDPKERMISDPVDNCPECGGLYYVEMPGEGSAQPPNPANVCFRCGYAKAPTVECSNCEREFTPGDWEDVPFVCDDCKAELEAEHAEDVG